MVIRFDSRHLGGRIIRAYSHIRDSKRKSFYNGKKAVILKEPLSDMLLMQYDALDDGVVQYVFYDVAVRSLFIDQFYGKNDFGYELYKKMHTVRGNYGEVNESEEYYKNQRKNNRVATHGGAREEHSIAQFRNLCNLVDDNGFDPSSVIMGDQRLVNINGSHRIALALYNDLDYISTEVHRLISHRAYTIDWFWKNGFTSEEIALIHSKMNQLIDEAKRKTGNYYCILFPGAEKYFDEIMRDIENFSPDNIQVKDWHDYTWEVDDFTGFLRGVYAFDSILPANLDRKIFYILNASDIREGFVTFRIVTLNIVNPMYRLKEDNGMPESVATVRLKDAIRGRYKIREEKFSRHYVGDYSHDVIIHSSDNFISNMAFRVLLSINKDVSEEYSVIQKYPHAFAVTTPDKMSRRFPANFYISEDFDLFILKKDAEKIASELIKVCTHHFSTYGLNVIMEKSKFGLRVRILYEGFTVTMYDLMYKLPGMKRDIVEKKFLCDKIYGTVWKLSEEDEFIYHAYKYLDNPNKKYHFDYLLDNREHMNEALMLQYFENTTNIEQLIKRIKKGR